MNYLGNKTSSGRPVESYPLLPLSPRTSAAMASTILQPAPSALTNANDSLQALYRQSTYLQKTLQSLLDAQSVGLAAGLGHAPPPAQDLHLDSSTRRHGSTSRSPQPPRLRNSSIHTSTSRSRSRGAETSPPSLSSARRAIHTTLVQLARNKAAEVEAYDAVTETHQAFLDNATRLDRKRATLQGEISNLKTGPEQDEIAALNAEEETLQVEIRVLEEELAVKKARLRDVKLRKEMEENEHEAKLSSWQRALEQVEEQINMYVLNGNALPDVKKKEGLWALPKDRRTTSLVQEEVNSTLEELNRKKDSAYTEGDACIRGAETWELCRQAVQSVEKALRGEMTKLRNGKSEKSRRDSLASEASSSSTRKSPDPKGEPRMHNILQSMDTALLGLERHLQYAIDQKWNPVVCAIGAELEALREGREVLGSAFGMSQVLGDTKLEDTMAQAELGPARKEAQQVSSDGIERSSRLAQLMHDDDGPSPDLLVSQVDDESR